MIIECDRDDNSWCVFRDVRREQPVAIKAWTISAIERARDGKNFLVVCSNETWYTVAAEDISPLFDWLFRLRRVPDFLLGEGTE